MNAIWNHDGAVWKPLAPTGFADEAALHTLVEQAPHLLPLAGSPVIAVIDRESPLGTGRVDLLGVEIDGRLVIIEVKLARNTEARRAVVAQILAYAAYLAEMDADSLERSVVSRYLGSRGYGSIADAVIAVDQGGMFDPAAFSAGLSESLRDGRFRLVLVLDAVPDELARLVAFLESVTDKLLIDLIAVSAYEVNGARLIVPQRVQGERRTMPSTAPVAASNQSEGRLGDGAGEFIASIAALPPDRQSLPKRLAEWALDLEREGLISLSTYVGKSGRLTLLPRLKDERVGLVTIWNDRGGSISLWRSVFARRAPDSIVPVETLIAPKAIGNGNTINDVSDQLLAVLADAYREANGKGNPASPPPVT